MSRGSTYRYRWGVKVQKLHKILGTPFNAAGGVPGFTDKDVAWAIRVVRERPDWAIGVLKYYERQKAKTTEER